MNPLEDLIKQLHDIEGIDPAPWWPLAPGWWFLILGLVIFVVCALWYIISKLLFYWSWKSDSLRKLTTLEKNLSTNTARTTVILLSEYLRRIAIQRFSRQECAGLTGENWLKWLTIHDPKKFDWETKGGPLIEIPYSPLHHNLPAPQIRELIQAAKQWVH